MDCMASQPVLSKCLTNQGGMGACCCNVNGVPLPPKHPLQAQAWPQPPSLGPSTPSPAPSRQSCCARRVQRMGHSRPADKAGSLIPDPTESSTFTYCGPHRSSFPLHFAVMCFSEGSPAALSGVPSAEILIRAQGLPGLGRGGLWIAEPCIRWRQPTLHSDFTCTQNAFLLCSGQHSHRRDVRKQALALCIAVPPHFILLNPPPVDTTKTRSDPQRVRMSSGERRIGAAKGKQPTTEALCQSPPPAPFVQATPVSKQHWALVPSTFAPLILTVPFSMRSTVCHVCFVIPWF